MARAKNFNIDKYSETYVNCRDLRHAWVIQGFYKDGRQIRRRLQCERCLTERVDTWQASGARVKSRYVFPTDYLVKGGLDIMTVRKTQMSRVTIFSDEDEMISALFGGAA